jgi:tetratricopeptide (TPR) repeat protein
MSAFATNGLLWLLALQAPQGDTVFVKRVIPAQDGRAERVVVAADKRSLDCLSALRQLADTMNWNVDVESTPLENDLRGFAVDLNLEEQDPRMVAQLVAVAGGADVVFDEVKAAAGVRPTLHVVRTPSADTESGRQRLRAMAGQWYRSFLRDELQYEPVVQRESVQVRMNLGQLLVENGDLESAIAFFTEAYEKRPHDHVGQAILRIADCHLDLAAGHVDRSRQKAEYAKAEDWVRRILDNMPSAPEVTGATIRLGRAMLGQATAETQPEVVRQRAERCQDELRARVIRLLDSAEMVDVWLLSGQAQFLMERADRVFETMLTLRESPWFGDMQERQFRDYHFLLGYGALGSGKNELAMRSLEWFLIHADNDVRRGSAYVLLAEAYLAQQRLLQARAAAVEARNQHLTSMNSDWRQRALRVWARTGLALGERESAFLELEKMVLGGQEPELSLFLVDQMLADRQWQRAIAVAQPMLEQESAFGDRARFKTIQALFEQALASAHLDDFPQQAIRLAPKIQNPELRQRSSAMIGDAYTRLGKLEHAADAYRGILR